MEVWREGEVQGRNQEHEEDQGREREGRLLPLCRCLLRRRCPLRRRRLPRRLPRRRLPLRHRRLRRLRRLLPPLLRWLRG